jgi:transcriptional regulator with XRE-family HTH domain
MTLPDGSGDDQSAMGTRLKLLRMKKRLSAKALAEEIDVSPSLISKIETGATNPSMDVLRKIVMHLHVNIADLMESEPSQNAHAQGRRELGHVAVVRANERKLLQLPQRGITYQMLTPDAQGPAEFMWVEMEPGEGGTEFFAHKKGEESVLVLEGTLNVYIGNNVFALNQGDCVTFDATQPHMYRNEGTAKAVWLYLAVPPTV